MSNRHEIIAKLRRDHAYMGELMLRIIALCDRRDSATSCDGCPSGQRTLCHGNIDQLIRSFVDVTLRHNLLESAFMADGVPAAHRIAHNQAHIVIAEQLQAIRLVFADDGNAVVAIEGIDRALATLTAHLRDFDEPLEKYLLAA